MIILEKIREICFDISTLFGLGESFLGSFIAELISLPLIFLSRFFYDILPIDYFLWTFGILFFISLLIIFLSLGFITDRDKNAIVLNKTIGMMFVFIGINLRLKIVVTGFVIFHLLRFFGPFIFYRIFNRRVESLPAHVAPLFGDVVYGITCNIFLNIILWIAS